MSQSTFVICYNAQENRYFEVDAIHRVEHQYRPYFYRVSLRLNFYNGDIDTRSTDDIRKLCFRKITKLMTIQNMWQNRHSFYVIDYEIRTIPRGLPYQHNNDEEDNWNRRYDDNDTSDESENSNYVSSTSASDDSAYISPTSVAGSSSDDDHLSESSAYSSDG